MVENEENQAKNTNRFPPSSPLPKGKSVAQCFNYCWVYFPLMRIQQLEPRLESKGLRQGLEEPLQGWPHTHIIWFLSWTIQLLTCCICCRAMAAFSLPLCSAVLKSGWLGAVFSLSAASEPRVLLRPLHPRRVCWGTRHRKRHIKG